MPQSENPRIKSQEVPPEHGHKLVSPGSHVETTFHNSLVLLPMPGSRHPKLSCNWRHLSLLLGNDARTHLAS